MKELENVEYVLALVQDMEDPKSSFDIKKSKYLNETEAKSEVKKYRMAARVKKYIEREARLVSNMNTIYGIIWGQCTPGVQSVLKGNEDFPSRSKKCKSLCIMQETKKITARLGVK